MTRFCQSGNVRIAKHEGDAQALAKRLAKRRVAVGFFPTNAVVQMKRRKGDPVLTGKVGKQRQKQNRVLAPGKSDERSVL